MAIIAHWTLDESSGTLVDSVGTADLTVTGTPTYGVAGQVDTAVDFEVNTPDYSTGADGWSFSNAVTFGGWIKAESTDAGLYRGICSKHNTTTANGFNMALNQSATNQVAPFIEILKDGTGAQKFGPSNLSVGVWIHLVGRYDHTAGKVALFIDGIKSGTDTDYSGGMSLTGTHNFRLGTWRHPTITSWTFDGLIDDYFVADEALSDTDIAYIHTNGVQAYIDSQFRPVAIVY